MQDGTAVYLGRGDVTAHSMACCADSAMMFPLGYAEGISISVDLKQLSSICPEVLKNAGVEADQLRDRFCSGKPSAIPSCSDFRAHFCPTPFLLLYRSNFPLEIEGAGNFDLFKQHEIGA